MPAAVQALCTLPVQTSFAVGPDAGRVESATHVSAMFVGRDPHRHRVDGRDVLADLVVLRRGVHQRRRRRHARPQDRSRARRRPAPRRRTACTPSRTGSPSGCSASPSGDASWPVVGNVFAGIWSFCRTEITALALSSFGVTTALMFGCAVNCCSNVVGGHRRRPRAGRLADLRVRLVAELRVQHRVVALREQLRVVVGRVAVHDQDVRVLSPSTRRCSRPRPGRSARRPARC